MIATGVNEIALSRGVTGGRGRVSAQRTIFSSLPSAL